ncbi:hypothetical protein SORBI_3009G080233 [Sorghum bicolor]|uniref:Uncharacterized protein n=1 Tax=Sorghum bicolor TaxID=4558 RepID=A0A1Z5R1H1_SORBI|nr:hypothetical protein SORBI_3009G080233 [Sorghum bicolor]
MKQVNLTTNESLRFFFDKETSPYVEGSFAKMGKDRHIPPLGLSAQFISLSNTSELSQPQP